MSNIIDLNYTIKFYYRVGANNLADVWQFLRKNGAIDHNGQPVAKDGE